MPKKVVKKKKKVAKKKAEKKEDDDEEKCQMEFPEYKDPEIFTPRAKISV